MSAVLEIQRGGSNKRMQWLMKMRSAVEGGNGWRWAVWIITRNSLSCTRALAAYGERASKCILWSIICRNRHIGYHFQLKCAPFPLSLDSVSSDVTTFALEKWNEDRLLGNLLNIQNKIRFYFILDVFSHYVLQLSGTVYLLSSFCFAKHVCSYWDEIRISVE